ncbi:hypothetical protein GCM10009864_37400 [Streptomyces lunalinharesii]|uniref:Uncharacterized protein n=1 Tax=Streptomyces lunalinharesii TaxID=333384 RepID=A0ABN3S0G5_9ACTN
MGRRAGGDVGDPAGRPAPVAADLLLGALARTYAGRDAQHGADPYERARREPPARAAARGPGAADSGPVDGSRAALAPTAGPHHPCRSGAQRTGVGRVALGPGLSPAPA